MTDTVIQQPKAVMIDPNYSRRNRRRIEDDEKELEELIKKASGQLEEEEIEEEEESNDGPPVQVDDSEPEDDNLSSEEKTFKKRYGDLRRHLSEKEKEWEEKFKSLEGNQAGFAPPKSEKDLEAWANKYPDVAGIVESIAAKKAREMFDQANAKFKELDDLNYETKVAKATSKIREAHSDFDKLKASDDFHDWADKQPKWIKDALYENEDDAIAVIRVIDLYKVDKGMTKTARKQQVKDAASDVKAKSSTPKLDTDNSGKRFKESEVMKMSDKEFEANYDKILEAQTKGNFIYDVTKK